MSAALVVDLMNVYGAPDDEVACARRWPVRLRADRAVPSARLESLLALQLDRISNIVRLTGDGGRVGRAKLGGIDEFWAAHGSCGCGGWLNFWKWLAIRIVGGIATQCGSGVLGGRERIPEEWNECVHSTRPVNDGAAKRMIPVGEATIQGDGTFVTQIDSVPADSAGEVELYFSWVDDEQGPMNTSATIRQEKLSTGVSLGRLSTNSALATGPQEGDVVEDLTNDTLSAPQVVEAGEVDDVEYPDLPGPNSQDISAIGSPGAARISSSGSVTPNECRSMGGAIWWQYIRPYGKASNTSRNVYVPVQRVRTEGRTSSRYAMEHTKGTKTSTFFQSGGGFVAGGVAAAAVQSASAGAAVNVASGKSRIVKSKWNYRKFKQMCRSVSSNRVIWWNMSGRSWQPHKGYLGQFSYGWWQKPFKCYQGNKRWYTASSIWVARSKAFYFSGSFTLLGALGASREQNQGSVSTKTFNKRSGQYGFTLCGQNDPDPSVSKDSKEVAPSS